MTDVQGKVSAVVSPHEADSLTVDRLLQRIELSQAVFRLLERHLLLTSAPDQTPYDY